LSIPLPEFHAFGPIVSHGARLLGENLKLGAFTKVEDEVLVEAEFGRIDIGSRCKLKRGVTIKAYGGHVVIGDRVSIGENTIIAGHGGVEIGDLTIVAGGCYISAQNHIFTGDVPIRFQGERALGISIGKNCWLGGRVSVIDGVSIGDGAVIGAGSVVTRSLPSAYVCWGSPCKPRRLIRMESSVPP
jgi:acetyltransferase-like isoleucine patch superfamily enzyme